MRGEVLTADMISDQALLTGTVMGMLLKAQTEGMFNITNVVPLVDEHGNYEPFVDVTMPSGKYRIGVVHQTIIKEEL